ATLQVATGITPSGAADGSPVTFTLLQPDGTTSAVVPPTGELAASVELIDVVIPGYADGLNALVKQFADAFNAAHDDGYDTTGAVGGKFFDYTDPDRAGSLKVLVTSTSAIAVSSVPSTVPGTGNNDTGNAGNLADSITIQDG